MEIKTKAMGLVEIQDEQIIELVDGFYGFEEFHKYALLDSGKEPFFLFRPDYELDIDDELLKPIEAESPKDLLVFALVTIPAAGGPITANLQGPLIINKKNKKAFQAVLNDGKWNTKHDILAELNAAGRN